MVCNFTTNFTKGKGYRLHSFHPTAEQLLLGTVSHGYFSEHLSHIFTKGRQLLSTQLRVQGQQYKNYTGCEICMKSTIKTAKKG